MFMCVRVCACVQYVMSSHIPVVCNASHVHLNLIHHTYNWNALHFESYARHLQSNSALAFRYLRVYLYLCLQHLNLENKQRIQAMKDRPPHAQKRAYTRNILKERASDCGPTECDFKWKIEKSSSHTRKYTHLDRLVVVSPRVILQTARGGNAHTHTVYKNAFHS